MITLTREEAQQVLDALEKYVCVVVSVNDPNSWTTKVSDGGEPARKAIETLRARLSAPEPQPHAMQNYAHNAYEAATRAQPEPEPAAWMWHVYNGAGYSSRGIGFQQTDIPFAKHTPLYTAPQQREWQGLTDQNRQELAAEQYGWEGLCSAVEAKLREKNT